MERDYWLRQEVGKPLFPDIEWSRPENRLQAGKLLIVGGNSYGFAAPAEAYTVAVKSGIGTTRILLPDAVRKVVGNALDHGEFAPSTPSGSFGQKALNELLLAANWSDAVLIAGDLGRNSETAILLEKFLSKSSGAVVLTKDAVDYVTSAPQAIVDRPETLLVLSLSQLQRLAIATKTLKPITFSMGILHLVEWLHDFTSEHRVAIVVKHLNTMIVAVMGQVSTTKKAEDMSIWRVATAAKSTVWWLQNPTKPFEAITSAVV